MKNRLWSHRLMLTIRT
jgi:cathepsin D